MHLPLHEVAWLAPGFVQKQSKIAIIISIRTAVCRWPWRRPRLSAQSRKKQITYGPDAEWSTWKAGFGHATGSRRSSRPPPALLPEVSTTDATSRAIKHNVEPSERLMRPSWLRFTRELLPIQGTSRRLRDWPVSHITASASLNTSHQRLRWRAQRLGGAAAAERWIMVARLYYEKRCWRSQRVGLRRKLLPAAKFRQ